MPEGKFYSPDARFVSPNVYDAFDSLSLQQRMYLHHLSKAAWEGHLINFIQTSPESPLIFVLLHRVLKSKATLDELRDHLIAKHNFSKTEVDKLFVYAAAFFTNGGNYRSDENSKFLPDVAQSKLAGVAEEVFGKEEFVFYAEQCFPRMFDESSGVQQLRLFPPVGITTYFSANCTEEDGKVVTAFLASKHLDAYNHRVFKTISPDGKNVYEIRFASVESTDAADDTPEQLIKSEHNFRGSVFRFTRGDYGKLLEGVNEELRKATRHPRNGQQAEMLRKFVKSFETGSLETHKRASQIWIKDKLPIVECHFGFIENYRDPAGGRSSFEAFAAVVTTEKTNLLTKLVQNSSQLIDNFVPWPKEFEKDRFLAPDFTSLDSISFSGYTVYRGVNLPNYDEIRQNEGFKNIVFSNILRAEPLSKNFISQKNYEFLQKNYLKAIEAQVTFHELLGHGTGKLLWENQDGTFNFKRNLIDPLTGRPVAKWYKPGDTVDTVFGSLSSAMEECRADAVGLLLTSEATALRLTGVPDNETSDITYANWLWMTLIGLTSLQKYDTNTKSWGEAHAQARFVIMNMLQQKVPELLTVREFVNQKDKLPDFELSIDRTKLADAKKTLKDFALHVQVYKSTADFESMQSLFARYSQVDSTIVSLNKTFAAIKSIIDQRRSEKTIFVQPNTFIRDSEAVLWTYEPTAEGSIKSFLDRFNNIEDKYKILKELYIKDAHHFPHFPKSSTTASSSLRVQSPSSSEMETSDTEK